VGRRQCGAGRPDPPGPRPFQGGFLEVSLRVSVAPEQADAGSEVATLTTSHRLLFFRAHTDGWNERRLELR